MLQDPQAQLARKYVEDFLRSKGLDAQGVRDLPPEKARQLMVDASTYAALKLAEVEKKSQIAQELHGGPSSD